MTTLLIDGDVFVFRCAYNAQEQVDWGNGLISSWVDTFKAQRFLKHALNSLKEKLNAEDMIIALSSPISFRKTLAPTYKENRMFREPLLAYKTLREFIKKSYASQELSGLEGDDVLGILATSPEQKDTIIISLDKDLKQIPGKHYNIDKPDQGITEVTSHQATLFFYTQVLTGDTTDGYAGCPGVGPKGAAKILDGVTSHKEAWYRIVQTYEKAGLTESDVILQARLARILRYGEYSLSKGPRLWIPLQHIDSKQQEENGKKGNVT